MKEIKTIVVTRHQALIALLLERGLIDKDTPVISHATPDDVRGKTVIGVLPLSLAALAYSVIEIPLNMTPEDRGKELSLERLREIAGDSCEYFTMTATDAHHVAMGAGVHQRWMYTYVKFRMGSHPCAG